MTTSTASTGTNARVCPSWPGCPPGRRPLASRRTRWLRAWGGSADGGCEEFCELRANLRANSSTVAFNWATSPRSCASSAACRRIISWAAGGVCSHISGDKGDGVIGA
jgi:hypothetical protein